jgi:hypothetical protein
MSAKDNRYHCLCTQRDIDNSCIMGGRAWMKGLKSNYLFEPIAAYNSSFALRHGLNSALKIPLKFLGVQNRSTALRGGAE